VFPLFRRRRQETANGCVDGEVPSVAFESQGAGLSGDASQQRPHLAHGGAGGGGSVHTEQNVPGFYIRHGRFAVVIGHAQDRVTLIGLGAQDQTDEIHVRGGLGIRALEVDGAVGIVDADAKIEKRVCAH
jgi:hypothetical protein